MTTQQFTDKLFAAAAAAGIAPSEVYYAEKDSVKIHTLNEKLDDYTVSTTAGLSFRGLVGGRMGYAYTEALDEEAIGMLVRGVCESAALVEDEDVQEIFAGSEAYAPLDTFSPALDQVPVSEHIASAVALEQAALAQHPEVTASDFNESGYLKTRVSITNSFGLRLQHQDNARYQIISVVSRRGERTADGVAFAIDRNPVRGDLRALTAEAVETAVRMLDAAPIDSGKMPAVIRKEAMVDLLGVFSGIFSAESAQKGLSLLQGKEGEAIAAPCVTLTDDPLLPDGMSSCPFDAEGVAAYKKDIITQGTLCTLLHNLKTARVAGVTSTGNAAKDSYSAPVRVAPSNLYLQPGEQPLEALLCAMGDGLLLTDLSGLHAGANPVSGDFSLLAKGYLVRGGKVVQAVEQITVAGNFYTLLQQAKAAGSDLFFGPSGVGSPSLWVEELSVAGK